MAATLDSPVQMVHCRADKIECWDDDPDFGDLDRIQNQQYSPSSSISHAGVDYNRREPPFSRMSIPQIYDLDPPELANREHQISCDDTSPAVAIKSAQSAGIPIPENVPPSALIGGTIKRLGPSKKDRKVTMHDDWGEDMELPPALGDVVIFNKKMFPETLHHLSEHKRVRSNSPSRLNTSSVSFANSQLNKFRDSAEGDLSCFSEIGKLTNFKVLSAKKRVDRGKSNASTLHSPPISESATRTSHVLDDDFENDFEFPADGPLQLGFKNADRSKLPVIHGIDCGFDDWGDADSGLGSSFGGTRLGHGEDRTGLVSPSISAMTMESEDDTPLEGLILPDGFLPDVHTVLEKRRKAAGCSPIDADFSFHAQKDFDDPANEEFFEGIEIGDGEIFDSKRLTLNRNVKQKQQPRKPSPVRRTAMSLTFTSYKHVSQQTSPSRINRLAQGHPTLLPTLPPLEPVAERESVPPSKRNPRNRWSVGTIIAEHESPDRSVRIPPPPPIPQSRTESQRNLSTKSPRNLRSENVPPTTTHVQSLRAKRSMPNMVKSNITQQKLSRPRSRTSVGRPSSCNSGGGPTCSSNSATRPTSSGSRPPSSGGRPASRTSSGRPPSRNEPSSYRHKTSHSGLKSFKHPAPFLPGGSSFKNSHHIASKTSKPSLNAGLDRRSTSRLQQRTTSRHSPSSSGTSNATKKGTPSVAPEHLRREAANIGIMTQPTRKRNFGDGTELETFDDLPTSAKIENRFTVTPVAKGVPKFARPKSLVAPRERDESPKKRLDTTPRQEDVPRFARDTNASRKAREFTQQRLGLIPSNMPNADRWRSKIATRNQATRPRKNSQQKPHLIKPMGSINTLPKENAANGMTYNPRTFRWEGNDRDLRAFDVPEIRTPPRPALITKVNQSGSKMGIQVVGGMVFDPSRMCWLKVDEDPDDELDPFEGLDDLPEDLMSIDGQSAGGPATTCNSVIMGGVGSAFGGGGRTSGGFGEFVVGEEFDVGPEFVKRQKEEEIKWRKGTAGWISADGVNWENRYLLKEILTGQL